VIDIQRQLNREFLEDEDVVSELEIVEIKFTERRRIVEAVLSDLLIFVVQKGFRRYIDFSVDTIVLCKRKERRRSKINHFRERLSIKTSNDQNILLKMEPEEKRSIPLKYKTFQCLFCLASDLPLEDKQPVYANKNSFQRYTDWCRFNQFKSDEKLSCPDLACDKVILEGKIHFKNYTTRIHDFFFYKPSISGTEDAFETTWDMRLYSTTFIHR
jgi:hypothetical protein